MVKKAKRELIDPFDVYQAMNKSIPEGAKMPQILGGITYMLADILLFFDVDSRQFDLVFDEVKKSVMNCIFKYKEATKQYN